MTPENSRDAMLHNAVGSRIVPVSYIDVQGAATGELPEFARQGANLISLHRAMTLTRLFDEKAVALQRTGRLGTYASSLGQEAVGVGAAAAMRKEDVLVPSFREHGAQIWRGVTLVELLQYWGGDERGSDFSGPQNDFPVSIPVASHFPHACGIGLAFQLRGEPWVAVCIGGDGATSKGEFYEAINIAGVWKLPAVFVIADNQWAISVPRKRQTAAETLAQKAVAAGIPGLQVEGNDVIAVRDVVEKAIARARAGEGPTLIEAMTYRLADHTTADDAHRYRDDREVSARWKQEPIVRLRKFLTRQHDWSAAQEEELLRECRTEVEQAVEDYLAISPEPVTAIFDHLYASPPAEIERQREIALREMPEGEDG